MNPNFTITCPLLKCADSALCVAPAQEELEQQCNALACEIFSVRTTEFGACSAPCGGGFRTRKVSCVSSFGFPVSLSKCQNVPSGFEQCNKQACDTAYYTYSGYGACSAKCGGGKKTRTAQCNTPAGSATADSECQSAGLQPVALEVACNTRACASYMWTVSAWGACSAACGGTRTRTATCKCGSLS
jgi:Thrombospondin type 1 domain